MVRYTIYLTDIDGRLHALHIQQNFFSSVFGNQNPLDPDWIRIRKSPEMLDPDQYPDSINPDPQLCLQPTLAVYTWLILMAGSGFTWKAGSGSGSNESGIPGIQFCLHNYDIPVPDWYWWPSHIPYTADFFFFSFLSSKPWVRTGSGSWSELTRNAGSGPGSNESGSGSNESGSGSNESGSTALSTTYGLRYTEYLTNIDGRFHALHIYSGSSTLSSRYATYPYPYPYPDSLEMLDPDTDPDSMNPNTHLCLHPTVRYSYLTDIDGRLHALHIQRKLHLLV